MNKCLDANGNLLKIGDRVKQVYIDHTYYDSCYDMKNQILEIMAIEENQIRLNNIFVIANRFVKVNYLKNKIRKLRKLIKK